MPISPDTATLLGIILGPSSVVALTVKLVLNGSKQKIADTKDQVNRIEQAMDKGLKDIGDDVKDVKRSVRVLHTRVDSVELNQAYEKGRQDALREMHDSKP